jgi:hypothetical protein
MIAIEKRWGNPCRIEIIESIVGFIGNDNEEEYD